MAEINKELYQEKLHKDILTIMDEIHRICEKHNLRYYLCGGSLLGAIRHNGFIPWDDDLDIMMPRNDFDRLISLCETELSENYYLDWFTTNKKYWQSFAKICLKNTLIQENLTDDPKYDTTWGIYVDIFPLEYSNGNIKKINFRRRVSSFCVASLYEKNYKDSKDLKVKFGAAFFSRSFLLKLQEKALTFNQNKKTHLARFNVQYDITKSVYSYTTLEPAVLHDFDGRKYYVPSDSHHLLTTLFGDNYMEIPSERKRRIHQRRYVRFSDGTVINLVSC